MFGIFHLEESGNFHKEHEDKIWAVHDTDTASLCWTPGGFMLATKTNGPYCDGPAVVGLYVWHENESGSSRALKEEKVEFDRENFDQLSQLCCDQEGKFRFCMTRYASVDERRVATSAYVLCYVWNESRSRYVKEEGEEKRRVFDFGDESEIKHVFWNPDGTKLATASFDGTCQLWTEISNASFHLTGVRGLCWDSRSTKLAIISEHSAQSYQSTRLGGHHLLCHIKFLADADVRGCWNRDRTKVLVIQDAKDEYSPIVGELSTLHLYMMDRESQDKSDTFRELHIYRLGGERCLQWNWEGTMLATCQPDSEQCKVWQFNNFLWESKSSSKHKLGIQAIAWNPKEDTLAILSPEQCSLWDLTKEKEVRLQLWASSVCGIQTAPSSQ